MYQSFFLLENKGVDWQSIQKELAKKGFSNTSFEKTAMMIKVDNYLFKIEYQDSIDEIKVNIDDDKIDVARYVAYLVVYGCDEDIDMDYFNDFAIICESLEELKNGILVDYIESLGKLSILS